jgi:hypothetical protein
MAKKIYTVIASCIAVVFTLAFVNPPGAVNASEPTGATASEDGQREHHRVLNRRHRAARKKARRRRAAIYVCPMHSDMRSTSPGTCPKCLMELVRKDAKTARPQ